MALEDVKKHTGTLASLIPDSYFDVLSRIVPGILAMALFGSEWIKDDAHDGVIIAFSLVVAYVAGFILDTFSEWIFRDVLSFLRSLFPGKKRFRNDDFLWKRIRPPETLDRAVKIKLMAEKALCRNLGILFLFGPLGSLPAGSTPMIMYALGAICFLCYFAMHRWLIRFVSDFPDKTGVDQIKENSDRESS